MSARGEQDASTDDVGADVPICSASFCWHFEKCRKKILDRAMLWKFSSTMAVANPNREGDVFCLVAPVATLRAFSKFSRREEI